MNLPVGLRAHLKTRQFSSLPGTYFLPEPLVSPLCYVCRLSVSQGYVNFMGPLCSLLFMCTAHQLGARGELIEHCYDCHISCLSLSEFRLIHWGVAAQVRSQALPGRISGFPYSLHQECTYHGHHCCCSWVLCLLFWIKSASGSEASSFLGLPCPLLPYYDGAQAELGVGRWEQFQARTPPLPCLIQSSAVFHAEMPLVSF